MKLKLSLCVIFLLFSSTFGISIRNLKPKFLNDGRIIGGKPASLGQLPYQVGLQIKRNNRFGTCGGSLISRNYILTAAHCALIDGVELIEVHLGTLVIKDDQHKVISVPKENFIIHEDYSPQTLINDIALLKLPEDAVFSDTIQPIALPTRSDVTRDFESQYLTISGWGRYSDDLQNTSDTLQYAEVKVLSQRICMHYYDAVVDSMICTYTGSGQGTCHGDSGGPLAYTDPNTKRTFIVGLTSFGSTFKCVQIGWPSVFTRITYFLDWISNHSDIVIRP